MSEEYDFEEIIGFSEDKMQLKKRLQSKILYWKLSFQFHLSVAISVLFFSSFFHGF